MVHTLSDSGVEVCFANPGTSEMHTRLRPRRCREVRRRAVPRRGRGHRRSRRLRAHGRAAGGDAAAPRSGTGQRVGQPAQRPSVAHPGGQHRRRPRHLPRSLRRPAGVRHRCARRGGVALGAPADARRGRRSGHGRRGRGGVGPARRCGHADPAGRRQLGRRRRGGRAPSATSRAARFPARSSTRPPRCCAAASRWSCSSAGVPCWSPACAPPAGIASATGARVLTQTHIARVQRGVGRPAFDALGYFAEQADAQLAGARHLVLVDCPSPVAFFAYPGRPSSLVPDGCIVHSLGHDDEDIVGALEALADEVGAGAPVDVVQAASPVVLGDRRRAARAAQRRPWSSAPALPDQAIVVEESITAAHGHGRRHASAPRRTTGWRSPAGRSARACRWPPAPRSPARTAR